MLWEELRKQLLKEIKLLLKPQMLEFECWSSKLGWQMVKWGKYCSIWHMPSPLYLNQSRIKPQDGSRRENPHASLMASRLTEFTRMNISVYYRSKTNKDPKQFIDEFHEILCAIGVDEKTKAEFTAYHLKDVAQVWYYWWAYGQAEEMSPSLGIFSRLPFWRGSFQESNVKPRLKSSSTWDREVCLSRSFPWTLLNFPSMLLLWWQITGMRWRQEA